MRLLVLLACVAAFSLGFLLERAAVLAEQPSSNHCGHASRCPARDGFAHLHR